jgi:hypothetical protein
VSSHTTHAGFKELNIVLSHIVKNYPTALNIYQMIDSALQDILKDESELPMIESVQRLNPLSPVFRIGEIIALNVSDFWARS